MDWLRGIAPTIASALGGPLAGLAVEALGSALGMSDASKEKVTGALQAGNMTGEQIAAVKQAEVALVAKLKELDIDLEKVHAGDRASAREMQTTNKSIIPGVLAVLITCGFFGILLGMLTGELSASENAPLMIMLGALGAAWGSVVNFYYGSSASSSAKNELLAAKR